MIKLLVVFLALLSQCHGLYLEGRLHRNQDWAFLGRFCFLSDIGKMKFKFSYPLEECCHNLLLYFDDSHQWPKVYRNDSKDCYQKEALLDLSSNQIINLTTKYSWSGCVVSNKTGRDFLHCEGGRSFRSMRERWWYMAISNCKRGEDRQVIDINYEMKLTNGHSFWREHFSADECGILETNIFFLIVFGGMFGLSIHVAVCLFERQLLHVTYKMFMVCLALEVFGLIMLCVALGAFARNGIENNALKVIGESLGSAAELLFLLLLLLLGKGFTVTRGKLSYSGTIKMSVFITVYAVIDIILFLYEYVLFDPGLVLYAYESPAGYGWIALRLVAWAWFTYGVVFTLKHHPAKSGFYYPLYTVYTVWFYAVPVVALITTLAIPRYMRAKVVNGIERLIDFLAYALFLSLIRPQRANKNFPYHVRTSQIGIVHNDGRETSSFPRNVYGNTQPEVVSSSGRVSDLFTVNANVANSTVTCTVRNGSSSLQQRPLPLCSDWKTQETKPPSYSEAFKAQPNNIDEAQMSGRTYEDIPLDMPDL